MQGHNAESFNLSFTFRPKSEDTLVRSIDDCAKAIENALSDVIQKQFKDEGFYRGEYFRTYDYSDDEYTIEMKVQSIALHLQECNYTRLKLDHYRNLINNAIDNDFSRWFGSIFLDIDERLVKDFYDIAMWLLYTLYSEYEVEIEDRYEDMRYIVRFGTIPDHYYWYKDVTVWRASKSNQ